jgi:hypothetical protein
MRTTVDIDEAVLDRAKLYAAANAKTLGTVVTDALAAYLATSQATADEPFELVVRGRPGARFPSAREIAEIEAEEDVAALQVQRRRRRAAS